MRFWYFNSAPDSILREQPARDDVARLDLDSPRCCPRSCSSLRFGRNQAELAFYDATHANDAAVLLMQDEMLRQIAQELVGIVRLDAKTDWQVKEQVRAKLRATIKLLHVGSQLVHERD